MKKIFLVLAVVLAGLAISGCASVSSSGAHFVNGDVSMSKTGEATNTVYFYMFGAETYPSVQRVAGENGITKVATVEKYWKLGVFGLWVDYTTIVTGE